MGLGNLYNLINGVDPATFLVLPMLGKHPDEYPRFRDCYVNKENHIIILTRVGGPNRNTGLGEEEMQKSPYFIKTYDSEEDSTYGYYEFEVPKEWKKDLEKMLNHKRPSDKYVNQMCKVYPKLETYFRKMFPKTS